MFADKTIRPLAVVVVVYQLLMATLVILFWPQVDKAPLWLLFHSLVMGYFIYDGSGIYKASKYWSPLLIIPVCFSELHYLVHTVHPVDYDAQLIAIDYFMYGVHPTVWLERFTYPWLTELLQIIYSTFYFLPIGLAIILLRNSEHGKFRFLIFQVTFGFFVSYIGYFLVPAIGPRFTLDHLQSFALRGLWLTQHIRDLLNTLENIQRDAFPSGHTALTLVVWYYARRYNKAYYYLITPVTVMMIYSTVYLRYHYIIDVIAGIALFGFVIWVGPLLYRQLRGNRDVSF